MLERGADLSPDRVVRVDPALMSLLPGVVVSQRQALDQMSAALSSGDRDTLRRLAHRVSGSFSMFGFEWAAWQCQQVQLDALHGEPVPLADALDRLRSHLQSARAEPLE